MRPSATVHPEGEAEGATAPQAPFPKSRKARKYVDRKAPKANFLSKVKWSQRRRSVFFMFTVAVFLVDVAVVLYYTIHLPNFKLPPIFNTVFLGWNFNYNTQGPGTMSASNWLLQKLWRSFWFYFHIVFSACVLVFRVNAIRHHEKDIGTCLRKDWQNAYLKVGRVLFFVAPVVLIYFVDVSKLENPRISNTTFYKECGLGKIPFVGRELQSSISGVNTTRCNVTTLLATLPEPEATYVGYVPETPLSSVMMTLEPVGEAVECAARLVLNNDPFFTIATSKPRVCVSSTYDFSNWITKSHNCSAAYYNDFYVNTSLPSYNYVEQWFCNISSSHVGAEMSVYYDTAFVRMSIPTNCSFQGDPEFLKNPPMQEGQVLVGNLTNITRSEKIVMAGKPYQELFECEEVEVSCVKDLLKSTNAQEYFFRTLGLRQCKRSFLASPTVATDQKRWDSWLADWQTSYKYAAAGLIVESVWDFLEFLAYMVI